MANYLSFMKYVGLMGLFGYYGSTCPLNITSPQEAFYKAVESADVVTVQEMMKTDRKIATSLYQGKPMLWGLVRATRLKNQVSESMLKKYARIINMVGKDAAALKIIKQVKSELQPCSLLNYAIMRCHPAIEHELIKLSPELVQFAPKPRTKNMDKKKEKQCKVAALCAAEIAPFLTEQITVLGEKVLKNGESLVNPVFFKGTVKDIKGRVLSGKIVAEFKEPSVVNFDFWVYSAGKKLCKTQFKFTWLDQEMQVYIDILETPVDERHNGLGGMLLDALVNACGAFGKKVVVGCQAYPYDNAEKEMELTPILIHFYKMHGFIPSKNDACKLTLTIQSGKVLTGYDLNELKKKK